MENKRGRGRPATFAVEDRRYLAALIRCYGISGARRETKIPVCRQTLSKIAHDFGITFPKGRRPKSAA